MDKKNIEDLYPLSPMQQGMLFHSLYDPGSGAYIEQMVCELCGDLDVPAFERAWQRASDRHPVLRTAFVGEGLKEPAQMVLWQAQPSLERQDWRGLVPDEQAARQAAWLRADRARGFELSKAPLLRLALLQLDDERYTFVWTYHHILLDGWSIPLLFKEVFALYEAFHRGEELRLDARRPFRDYIVRLKQRALTDAEPFWRRLLHGFTTPTSLLPHLAHAGADGQAERHEALKMRVATELTTALASLAQQQRMTVNTLAQAVWALLLNRYTGEQDVLFGMAVSGRPADMAGVESMIGMFMNTLPMRVRVSPDAWALPWLHEVRALQIEIEQYDYSPLLDVHGWSQVPRGTPLFESMLVFQGHIGADSLLDQRGSVDIRDIHFVEAVNYPLVVDVVLGLAPSLNVLYSARRFDSGTIMRMMRHFTHLLNELAANPHRRLAELPLMTKAERYQLLVAWNDTAKDYPEHQCLHQLFAAQVARTPDAVALVFDETKDERRKTKGELSGFVLRPSSFVVQLTYAELNVRANRLAQLLVALGVGPEVCVGVCLQRSIAVIVALLGILKAGGTFLPLDPAYPASRLDYMLHDSRAAVLLVHAGTLAALQVLLQQPPQRLRALACLDHSPRPPDLAPALDFCNATTPPSDGPLALRLDPQHLAYLMYTSGSTGAPKGVPIPHRNAVAFFNCYQDLFGLRSDDQIIQYHSLSFDFSTWEIFEALLAGACLHMAPEELARDVGALSRELVRVRITVLNMTPSQFSALADDVEHVHRGALAGLRILVLGGELLPTALAQRAAQLTAPSCRLYNEYGPTETTISSAILPLTGVALRRSADRPGMSIGRPIGNTQLYVLDERMDPAPLGAVGELYIGGVGLARGYLARPDLTAERFVPNPFLKTNDQSATNERPFAVRPSSFVRLYKTGDLARYLPDGALEVLGRRDTQIKLRGFRIELGEIEASLRQHPAVSACALMVYEGAPSATDHLDKRLVAYVVPVQGTGNRGPETDASRLPPADAGQTTSDAGRIGGFGLRPASLTDELRAFLAERLPDYMLPSAWVMLDALPLTPNGKLDHRALPAPDQARPEQQAGFVAPRTPTEAALAQVWAEVLGLEQVGVRDDFFGLGGHSLSATRVIVRANQALDVHLSVRMLFLQPTIEKLATTIDNARAVSASSDAVAQRIAELKARIAQLNAQASRSEKGVER
jgi:amino acid adenylation domain-containing protein